jgi:hypothetical protein
MAIGFHSYCPTLLDLLLEATIFGPLHLYTYISKAPNMDELAK